MRRASILTSLYDGTPFLSTRTNKNDGTWQRPSVPLRFLEIPLPCTRFRLFRLRRESNLDYGKHVCVVVEADKGIILLALVGDRAKAALLVVLREKTVTKRSLSSLSRFRSLLSFSHDQLCTFLTWNNVGYIDQRAKKRDSVRKKLVLRSRTLSARSFAKEKRKKKN